MVMGQLVPRLTLTRVKSYPNFYTHVTSYLSQVVPKLTRTPVISYPSYLIPMSTRTLGVFPQFQTNGIWEMLRGTLEKEKWSVLIE